MEVTDATPALWEAPMSSFTDSPAARPIGLARVRELAAQTMPTTTAGKRSLAEVLTEAAGIERAKLASARYYSATHGGDWPEDH